MALAPTIPAIGDPVGLYVRECRSLVPIEMILPPERKRWGIYDLTKKLDDMVLVLDDSGGNLQDILSIQYAEKVSFGRPLWT